MNGAAWDLEEASLTAPDPNLVKWNSNFGRKKGSEQLRAKKNNDRIKDVDSDTGNRTPGYRVRGDNVSHYTISELFGDKL